MAFHRVRTTHRRPRASFWTVAPEVALLTVLGLRVAVRSSSVKTTWAAVSWTRPGPYYHLDTGRMRGDQ